ncbi:MAG: hypothetical protein ACK5KP_07275 [Paludibacteraceae bacterium]
MIFESLFFYERTILANIQIHQTKIRILLAMMTATMDCIGNTMPFVVAPGISITIG